MSKVKIKYVGCHQPNAELEVDERKAEGLVLGGEYKYVEDGEKASSDNNRIDKNTSNTRIVKQKIPNSNK